MIQHIKASNLLSFGPDGLDLEMRNLNVLIGPNGSGKSNFLEIFELLRALPRGEEDNENIRGIIQRSGGWQEWMFKKTTSLKPTIDIETVLSINNVPKDSLQHNFSIDNQIKIFTEKIGKKRSNDTLLPSYERNSTGAYSWSFALNRLEKIEDVDYFSDSILSKDFGKNVSWNLAQLYSKFRLYREWSFGRNSIFRTPQRADMRNDRLESDYSNLGMFLMRLRKEPATKRALIAALQDLYAGITDFEVIAEGGYVQILFTEGDYSVPAIRLSDGTLRYLCLLAILLDPTPPPLICIEEPELGLHPDIMPKLADLLVDASSRTQLIVTTHSDVLIDALGNSGHAESVLVCEKHDGQTQIRRLQEEDLAHWLKDYGLGQLWMRGEIGGTRW